MPKILNHLRLLICATLAMLAACDYSQQTAAADDSTAHTTTGNASAGGVTMWNEGQAKPLSLQVAHPNGAVLQVSSIQSHDMDTTVGVRVINGRDKDIDLNRFNKNRDGYLLLDSGEKLYLSPPPTNTKLTVPAGQTFEGELVFLGRLPAVNTAILVLNENSSGDNEYTTTPGFRVDLPLGQAASAVGGAQQ